MVSDIVMVVIFISSSVDSFLVCVPKNSYLKKLKTREGIAYRRKRTSLEWTQIQWSVIIKLAHSIK